MRKQGKRGRRNFLEFLVDKDLLSPGQMEDLAEELGNVPDIEIRQVLLERYLTSEEEIYSAWAEYLGLPYIDLRSTIFEQKALELIPSEFARRNYLIPFGLYPGEICIAFDDLDVNIVDKLERQTECDVLVHIATKSRILEAIEVQYGAIDIETAAEKVDLSKYSAEVLESRDIADTGPVIGIGNGIIINALRDRASDIHIEPREDCLQIRYRVDGVLQKKYRLDRRIALPLISRYKIMADLDIAEKRMPQDGRIQYAVGERQIDMRVSVMPGISGEKIVLRILYKSEANLDMDRMLFSKRIFQRIEKMVSSPQGIFFVTGPTGSGKTTTLYAILKCLNSIEQNIVTIEDPVEYRLPLISQIQVNHEIGLDFSTVLRSVLRQDPDVILVGEIRDLETAKIAAEAALTGHLVFSTLHTNNAVEAIMRLVEIGVEPFIVAPSLIGVLAQRLVRRICQGCKEEYTASSEEMSYFGLNAPHQTVKLYRGKGCRWCTGTGYFGRLAVHELVVVTDDIRELICQNAMGDDIARAAYDVGYRSMRFDGLKKALRGLTTLSEVLRVTTAQEDFLQL